MDILTISVLVIIVLLVVCIIGYVAIRNLLYKTELYEDHIQAQSKSIDDYNNWISYFDEQIHFILNEMERIDYNKTFESDDEVGFFFQRLKDLISTLEEFKIEESGENQNG